MDCPSPNDGLVALRLVGTSAPCTFLLSGFSSFSIRPSRMETNAMSTFRYIVFVSYTIIVFSFGV